MVFKLNILVNYMKKKPKKTYDSVTYYSGKLRDTLDNLNSIKYDFSVNSAATSLKEVLSNGDAMSKL